MLLNLLTGLPVMLLCLLLQAMFVARCLRYYVRFRHVQQDRESQLLDILLLSMVMLLMLLGNFVQMAIWAANCPAGTFTTAQKSASISFPGTPSFLN